MEKKKRYIIWTIGRQRRAGARVLYDLYHRLRKKDYQALIFCPEEHLDGYEYIDTLDDETLRNDIVVYPEIVYGNPLRFQNVARFVLYFPGKLNGEEKYHPSEAVFTWSKDYCSGEWLAWNTIDLDMFKDEGLPRTHDSYFYNKSGKWRYAPEIKDAVEINMDYPATRAELAKILKTTRILYSFESTSVLHDEAVLCGAKVKIIKEDGFCDYRLAGLMTEKDENILLNNFIRITQNMNYTGELQEEEKFFCHVSGVFYKAAARCAALGAWEECLRYCRKAWLGAPLERPSLNLNAVEEETKNAEKETDGSLKKEKDLVAKFINLVRKKNYNKAEETALKNILRLLKSGDRLISSIWAANLALLYEMSGKSKESAAAAIIAFELNPFNLMAARLVILGLLDKKAFNLALNVISRSLAISLRPLDIANAFPSMVMLGYIAATDAAREKMIAARLPELIASARQNETRRKGAGLLGDILPVKDSAIYKKLRPELDKIIYRAAL